ncbi:hypothetical protein [Rubripirellula reticaptiva]|uniref:DUF4168 domain-containing protein n=1 Tax=Rubripirellula reticaptiva TaxID=2528013 RepID=A0A5C6F454_9BACT|nr:hypothetical protein [Rubripirellula reticaptiva]TWU55310.1 hypothetical protein Poly59_16070 [Rubripirellula reticaptiva]
MTVTKMIACLAGLTCLLGIWSSAIGQISPPQKTDSEIEFPKGVTPPIETTPARNAAKAQQEIREALQGKTTSETGDGVLDDILQVIKSQGSVLDGSVLDASDLPAGNRRANVSAHHRAVVAEQLLRSARMLFETGPIDDSRGELIRQMRSEAARLLTPQDQ